MPFSILSATADADTTGSAATDGQDTTGADLIVVITATFSGATDTITDSESNTWSTISREGTPSSYNIHGAYCVNPTTSASHTFTYSETTSYPAIAAVAVSGVDTSDAFEASSSASGSASPGSITPTVDGSLLVAGLTHTQATGSSLSIDNSFTIQAYTDYAAGAAMGVGLATLIQATAAAVNPAWSNGGATVYTNMLCFNPAAGGGGTVNEKTLTDTISNALMADSLLNSRLRNRLGEDSIDPTSALLTQRLRERFLDFDQISDISDSILDSTTRNRLATDTIDLDDSLVNLQRFRNRIGSDSIELADPAISLRLRLRILDDSVDPVASIVATIVPAGGVTVKTLTDTVDLTDSLLPQRFRERLLADTLDIADGSIVERLRNRLGSDNVTVTDFISDFAVRNVRLGDTIELTDDGDLLFRLRNRTAGDTIDLADSLLPLRLWTKVLDDSFEPVDSISKLYIPFEAVAVRIRLSDDNLWIVVDVDASGDPELGSVLANFIVPGDDT